MSAENELDIRWPIGLLFVAMGALLAAFGALSPERTVFRPDLGDAHALNLNLWWGLVMVAFGAFMIAGALRAGRPQDSPPATSRAPHLPND